MKLPNWFKIVWWVLLSSGLIIVLSARFKAIQAGTATSVDAFLFLVLTILLLLPLFQEFDFIGLKLKAQIAEVKSEVKDQFSSLRQDILTIGVNTNVNPHIYLNPPSDASLPDLEKRFKGILNEALKEQSGTDLVDIQNELLLPNDVNYLFTVRYTVEKELRRIWQERFDGGHERIPVPIFKIVNALRENELIGPIGSVIREVYSACSPAIHGEEVSKKQVQFVKDIAPELITALMKIK